MQSGSISFTRLFEYIKLQPEIPHKDDLTFSGFKDLYLELVKAIPNIPGWYAWIRHSAQGSQVVYLGQSQTRKTASLQARLREEFLDEFVALWATVWSPETVMEILDEKYHGKYTTPIKRSIRKAGATHILWLGRPHLTDEELDVVEHNLIKRFNPPANKQSRAYSNLYQELTSEAANTLTCELTKLASKRDNATNTQNSSGSGLLQT